MLALAGCRADEPVERPASIPPGTETFVALLRAQLDAPDPVEVEYRIACESHLLRTRLNGRADSMMAAASAIAYTEQDGPARRRVDAMLANRVFPVGEPACREPYVDPDTVTSR